MHEMGIILHLANRRRKIMPEIYDSNPRTKSKYDGEAVRNKKYAKLGARITDNVPHKLFGLKTTDEEYWGLREILTEPEVDIALTMKQSWRRR